MKKIHLLVDDDYVDEFVNNLPKEKVLVIENDFEENQTLLEKEFKSCRDGESVLTPYNQSMKELSSWIKEREN